MGATNRTNQSVSAQLTFQGKGIAWVGTRSPSGGDADVHLDGTKVKTVSLKSVPSKAGRAFSFPRMVLFSEEFGQRGWHTITIRAAGNGDVDVDASITFE